MVRIGSYVMVVALASGACGSDDGGKAPDDAALSEGMTAYTLRFRPTVNGEDFVCGEQYDGIGMGSAKIRVLDFRLWLHDIALVRANGERVALALDEARPSQTIRDHGAWQRQGVALLDFEDAQGSCEGTPETRATVVGLAPERDDYVGVTFKVGMPEALNHLDATVAEYPFGAPGMAWQWKSGYRFVRIDVETEKFPKYYFHLGSTACEGEIGSFSCAVKNVAEIALDGFDATRDEIEADLASIYDELDVDAMGEITIACMSGGTDNPLCPSMFGAFGLGYGERPAGAQRFFRVREAD